jgi:hypothetical protein
MQFFFCKGETSHASYWYLLTSWLYSPLRALASLNTDANSLSIVLCRHLLTFVSCTSILVSSSHLNRGLPPLFIFGFL